MSMDPDMFLQRGRRRGIKRGVFLLPNLCTTANLFCGFFAIVSTLQMEFVTAAVAIIAGGIFDFLDGRVARLANAESEFGIEYDSLVDLASFGLAPGILMYFWSLSGFPRVGWLVAFLYFACGALRLARFNVQIDSVEKNFFQGLPIPSAAYMIATTVILHDYISDSLLPKRSVVMVGMVAVLALLMVSTIRYRSFKHMDFHTRWPFFSLVLTVGTIFIIASEPQITLFVLVLLYVVSGLAEELITLRKSRALVQRIKERRDAHRGGHRPSDVHGFDQSGEDLH